MIKTLSKEIVGSTKSGIEKVIFCFESNLDFFKEAMMPGASNIFSFKIYTNLFDPVWGRMFLYYIIL